MTRKDALQKLHDGAIRQKAGISRWTTPESQILLILDRQIELIAALIAQEDQK